MKVPPSIKVGSFIWTLVPRDSDWHEQAGAYGDCHKARLRIQYDAEAPTRIIADTLLHESIHAFGFTYGWEEHDFTEESMALKLPVALASLFNDNPEFAKWWNWARQA